MEGGAWWAAVRGVTESDTTEQLILDTSREFFMEGLVLKLKLQYFGHLTWRTNWLEKTLRMGNTDSRRRRGRQRMRWFSLRKLQEIVKDREAWRAPVHVVETSQTQLSDWTTTNAFFYKHQILHLNFWALELLITDQYILKCDSPHRARFTNTWAEVGPCFITLQG